MFNGCIAEKYYHTENESRQMTETYLNNSKSDAIWTQRKQLMNTFHRTYKLGFYTKKLYVCSEVDELSYEERKINIQVSSIIKNQYLIKL